MQEKIYVEKKLRNWTSIEVKKRLEAEFVDGNFVILIKSKLKVKKKEVKFRFKFKKAVNFIFFYYLNFLPEYIFK